MATSVSDAFDCRTCGACCVNPPTNRDAGWPWWVEVEPGDRILFRPDLVENLVAYDADGAPHLRLTDDGRCRALRGSMGRNVTCGIYRERPSPCRRVKAGDALCRRYRRDHGLDQ